MSIRHPRWQSAKSLGKRPLRKLRSRAIARSSATIAAGLVVLFAAGACGAGESSHSASSNSGGKVAAPAQGGAAQAGAGGAQDNAAAPDRAPNQAPVNLPDTRSIIYTGTMSVRVTKVDDAATKAAGYAAAAGGFVGGDDRKTDADGSTAQLILRVPSARFDEVIGQLHGLGTELVRALSSQDVTADVADVNARIANAEASVNRVRALMDKAQTITDITTLESELSRQESDLESLQARQRALTDQTSLSTITISLYGPETPAPVTTKQTKKGFVVGLSAGWGAFVAFLVVFLTVLGALLPWLLVFGLVAVLPWMLYRRRRQARLVLAPAGMPPPVAAAYPPPAAAAYPPPAAAAYPPPAAPAPTPPTPGAGPV